MTARIGWRLGNEDLRSWLNGFIGGGRSLIAPVQNDQLRTFRPVAQAEEICLEAGKTRWSPKEYFFPRSEVLYNYSFTGADIKLTEPPADDRQLILFGLRPCDAAAMVRLDSVFLGGEIDPFYARRRSGSILITLSCPKSDPECFCTAVGGSPASEDGCDVMVIALDDEFLLYAVTDKGSDLLESGNQGWAPANADDWHNAQKLTEAVEQSIESSPFDPDWPACLEEQFGEDVWKPYGELCLSCSICSSVCPTCSCFDMAHDGTAWGGAQFRTWDACTFSRFTTHASGHDPRTDQAARYRQRILHKFAYRQDHEKHNFRCVGCGRCTSLCPAGLDIQQAVREIVENKNRGKSRATS